jgi:ADP-ribose pyrophosphatase YjhB (NUDIX family)
MSADGGNFKDGKSISFSARIPKGDDRERLVCDSCGFVDYKNPQIVVGSVVTHGSRILMCRRAIHPRKGYWTLPAGYMELHETSEEGAMREAQEEACASIEIEALLAVYSIPRISQVQLMYKARLADPEIAAGPESLEVALFEWDEIPWDEVAFPSVHWALGHFREVRSGEPFVPFSNPPGELGDAR